MNFDLDETLRVIAASAADVLAAAAGDRGDAAGRTGAGPTGAGRTGAGRTGDGRTGAGRTGDGSEAETAAAWQALAEAGLLALTLPEPMGGDDLGVLEAAVLLTEVGRQAAEVPALATIMPGALPVTRWGGRDLAERVLVGVGAGETILAAEVRERSTGMPAVPATTAVLDGAGQGTVSGTKVGVPYAATASWILVPAAVTGAGGAAPPGDGPAGPAGVSRAVVVVDAAGPGVGIAATPSSGGTPEYTVRLDAAPVAGVLGGGDDGRRAAAVDDLYLLAAAGAAALADGAVAGALDLTGRYIATREQFGRPLATFQAVAGQAADVYITSRTLHLAALSACWRLSAGRDAGQDADVAAYWLASEAPPALRTCHQLHGGIGLDVGYPLHRYSAMISDLTRFVGGAAYRLELLGGRAATEALAQPAVSAGSEPAGRTAGMFIELTREQRALRDELRSYFAGLISAAQHDLMLTDRHGRAYQDLIRRLGRDGWLGVGWPVTYGGPTVQAYGTPEQKQQFLPRNLRGEVHFAIGYTEPGAGTDLASLTTRAVRDGDAYVVNGQKIFTTGAHDADYIWLACRTDPDAPKHKGISILIVDTADPGFSWTPIITCDGAHHVNATCYSDVRVPAGLRVRAENQGWRLVTTQLNHERVMLGPAGRLGALYDRVRDWACATRGPDGRPVARRPDVRSALAEVGASLRVNELLNWQVAVADTVEIADASATKVFSSERVQRFGQLLADAVGRHGDPADEPTAELMTWLDVQQKRNLVLTFGGGVNEVQRELIAMAGLKLPRVPR